MFFRIFLVFVILITTLTCGKKKYTVLIREAETTYHEQKNPRLASQKLIPHVNKADEDQLLFMMEAGMLLHAADDYETSNKILLKADSKADKMAKSVSKEVAAYLTNERGKPYKGEDYERVLLNMILGLNFLKLGEYDSALVEFKKVTYKLSVIKKKTRRAYKMNLMAKYLGAVSATAAEEYEFAYVELKQIEKLRPGIGLVATRLMQTALLLGYDDDYRTFAKKYPKFKPKSKKIKKYSDIILAYEAGKAPIKISRGGLLKEPGMRVALRAAIQVAIIAESTAGLTVAAAMALLATAEHPIPKYKKRDYDVNHVRVILENGETQKSYRIESQVLNNVERTMIRNYEDHYAAVKSKMIKRIAVKVVATIVAQQAAEKIAKNAKASGPLAGLIGFAAGAVVGAATLAQERPDLRCWHTLPATFQAGQVSVKPGTYKARVEYHGERGGLIEEVDYGLIEVKAKTPTVLIARSID